MSDESSASARGQSPRDGSTGDAYLVIARRYRPQVFDELVGQEHVARALQQAIASDRVGHAYLFTGARGVGKTSAARILAKALNCLAGPTPAPCNACDLCRSISTGDDVDVLEIDGASNRGIDEIRQLRQNVAVRPSRSRFKIYIIDEVHMLTKEAFNALLKTLEEPPEHVKFIFATTEPQKIPVTILSRCQRFDFAGIDGRAIGRRLEQIAVAEGVQLEPEAVQILSSRAAGSMRDSQSLLEQLLAVAGGKISADDVNQLLGIAPVERLSGLVRHLVAHDSAAALGELDAAVDQGVEVGQLLDQLIGYFRDVMAAAAGCPAEQMLYALPSQVEEVAEVGRQLGLHTILAIVQILDQTAARMRVSLHGRTLVEMAVVRICELDDLDDLAALVAELRGSDVDQPADGQSQLGRPSKKNAESRPASRLGPHVVMSQPATQTAHSGPAAMPPSERAYQVDPPHECPVRTVSPGIPQALTDEQAGQLWQRAILQLGNTVGSSAAHAERVTVRGDDLLVASFPVSYSFCRDICERPENRTRLERALAGTYGGPIRLQLDVHEDRPGNQVPQCPARASRREQLAAIAERPFVRGAMELFDVPPGQFHYVPPEHEAQ